MNNDEQLNDVLPFSTMKVDRFILSISGAMGPWLIYKGMVTNNQELKHKGGAFLFFFNNVKIDPEYQLGDYITLVLDMIEKLKLVEDYESFEKEFQHTCESEFYRAKAIFTSVDVEKCRKTLNEHTFFKMKEEKEAKDKEKEEKENKEEGDKND